MATNSEIATIIYQQLGGGRFSAMTGIKPPQMLAVEKGLRLKLPRNKSKANILVITLTPTDEYKIEFIKATAPKLDPKTGEMREGSQKVLETVDGVYAESLQGIFTDRTGYDTHL